MIDGRTRRVCVNPDTENTRQICLIEEHQFSVCFKIRSFWKTSRSCLLTKAAPGTLVQGRVFARLHQTHLILLPHLLSLSLDVFGACSL